MPKTNGKTIMQILKDNINVEYNADGEKYIVRHSDSCICYACDEITQAAKDLLTLISECVPKKERLGLTKEVRAFFKGFNNCRSQFLKNISERSGISEETFQKAKEVYQKETG